MQNAQCKMKNEEPVRLRAIVHFALNILHFAFSCSLRLVICALMLNQAGVGFAAEKATEPATAENHVEAGKGNEIHGVSLGDFRIRSYYPVDAQKSTVRFTLYATVKDGHFAEVQRLVEAHRQKLRDQIITATRLAQLAVFQEPDLGSFRRRVLVRLRRAVPELTIDDLYVSEFDLTIKSL
jgi:hypothetical protein